MEKQESNREKNMKDSNLHGLVLKVESGVPGGSYKILRRTDFYSPDNERVYGWDSFSNRFYEKGEIDEETISMLEDYPDRGYVGSVFERRISEGEFHELTKEEFGQFVQRINENPSLKEFYKNIELRMTKD